jgi:hypothetical protein
MADKLEGRAVANNSIPADRITGTIALEKFDSTINNFVNDGGRPFVKTISYFGSNTTANINGNQTITLTGQNFKSNIQIYVNGNAVPAISRTNANSVSFTTAAQSAGTYLVYAINPDGGFAILVPGIVYA